MRTKSIFIYLGAAIVAFALAVYGVKMVERIQSATQMWGVVQQDAEHAMHSLHELLARFGYGGFIDKYRRFQVHPDAALIPGMQADLSQIDNALQQLDHPHLRKDERQALQLLQLAVAQYTQNIAGFSSADPAAEPVVVDEQAALRAIDVLTHHTMHEGTDNLAQAETALQEVVEQVYLGFILVLLIFAAAMLFVHQRRRLAEAMAESEAAQKYLESILSATPDALLMIDSHGRIQDANLAAIRLFGYERENFLGLSVEDVIPERMRAGHVAKREGAFERGNARPFALQTEFIIKTRGGDEIPVDISISYLGEGRERVALTALRDISERKAMETQLRERQADLAAAQSIAHIGSWVWLVQPDQLEWSDEVYRIFGLDIHGHAPSYATFMQMVHPDDRVRLGAAVARTLEDDTPYEIEHRVMRPDGSERFVVEKGRLSRDAQGQPLRMVGTVWDITERKLLESRMRFDQAIIEGMSQPVVIVTQQGLIEDVNPAYCEMSGYRRAELLGQPSNVLKSGRHDAIYYQGMWDSLAKNRQWHGEIWIRRKDGAIVPRLLAITTICAPELDQCRYVGFYSDITSLKESEAKLEKLAHFDQLTGLANRMLFQDRLRAAIARAHRSTHLVGLLYIDLDGFKQVNDTLGHHAGDMLLIDVGQRLKACVREDDTVARLGGDEFALVLNELEDADTAADLAQRILEHLQIRIGAEATMLQISASIGVALYPAHGEKLSLLLERADLAMYQAKQSGKNAFVFYQGDGEAEVQDHGKA